jgi:hypothetical protein
MYVSFKNLSDNSRLWIYQANRPFSETEEKIISESLNGFCEQWAAHGHALKTSFKIEHHQFVLLAADESFNLPSGCAIDSSVHIIKDLQKKTDIDFFNRSLIAFLINEKVSVLPMTLLKDEFASGTLSSNTLTFNNLVATKAEWQTQWVTPVKNTWLARYLPKSVVVP